MSAEYLVADPAHVVFDLEHVELLDLVAHGRRYWSRTLLTYQSSPP